MSRIKGTLFLLYKNFVFFVAIHTKSNICIVKSRLTDAADLRNLKDGSGLKGKISFKTPQKRRLARPKKKHV